jgi:hypothetical protein
LAVVTQPGALDLTLDCWKLILEPWMHTVKAHFGALESCSKAMDDHLWRLYLELWRLILEKYIEDHFRATKAHFEASEAHSKN